MHSVCLGHVTQLISRTVILINSWITLHETDKLYLQSIGCCYESRFMLREQICVPEVQKGWSGCYASFVLYLSRISLSDYALRRLPSAARAELSCSFTVYLLDIAGCCRTLYLGAYGVTVMQMAMFPELASLLA